MSGRTNGLQQIWCFIKCPGIDSQKWGEFTKNICAENCMKCLDLHMKYTLQTPTATEGEEWGVNSLKSILLEIT